MVILHVHKYKHNAILVLKKIYTLYSQKHHVNSYCEFGGSYFLKKMKGKRKCIRITKG